MKLGVFGGSFDPPHAGHRALAEAALQQLQLDQLRIIPTGQAWHKARPLSDAQHRLAMAELAFADLPRVTVDGRETRRSGPSYTVDTLRELLAEFPDAQLFLLMGQDQAEALPTWHAWTTVVQLATIVVAAREDGAGTVGHFVPPQGMEQRFVHLRSPVLPVSATAIRQRAAQGQGTAPLVSDPVARYIVHHHLYRSA